MSNGKFCKPHGIPENICARCVGAREERERIIALLEAERDAMRSSRSPSDWEQSYGLDIAIALIKGENE